MKKSLILLPILALAACATPRESCISQAQRTVRLLDRQISTAQGNIQRGYALATVQDVHTINTHCTGTNEDGSTFRFPCQEVETVDRQVPVSINVAEERAKLADMQSRRTTATRTAEQQVQQCIAVHPE